MKVFFENNYGVRRIIGETADWNATIGTIRDFMIEHKYTAPYWRIAHDRTINEVMIDVGSHSEFFYIEVPESFSLEKKG